MILRNDGQGTRKEWKKRFSIIRFGKFAGLTLIAGGLIFYLVFSPDTQRISAEDAENEIEKAIFTKQEFFGASANVPLPTAITRENLARLAENQPDNIEVLKKLAEANEKLERFDEAEKILIRLAENDLTNLENLAAFYERRGKYNEQAEILEKIFNKAAPENRSAIFERLLNTARRHDLKQYLTADFFARTAQENTGIYGVFVKLIENLTKKEDYAEALNFARQAKMQFPEHGEILLEKEIEILQAMNQTREAEIVYRESFDPFWSDDEAGKFYGFLSYNDRLRAYGSEIKARFDKNPADFDAGIRLALFRAYDYGDDDIVPIIARIEKAKANWTTAELVTAARLLLKKGAGATASRFLYTLYSREDFKNNQQFRAQIIYQLFAMFTDAENERLPLTKGDLQFYKDIACADTDPGIATGILSLIFSDANPGKRLEEQETMANKYFNRAAAYRIFVEYKNENPASPELAQMYLDIVRLYAATKEPEIAEQALNEFAAKYQNSRDYADAALKLADAFVAAKNEDKAREVYRQTLDYLGKQSKFHTVNSAANFSDEFADDDNDGKLIPLTVSVTGANGTGYGYGSSSPETESSPDYYFDAPTSVYRDYLSDKNAGISYEDVLQKLVTSLSKEKKTPEILQIYSEEIAKYPNEEWLYRQRLDWLEQTNLVAEQLAFYKTALAKFETNEWRDKLARFFVRQKRDAEFAEFSTELIGKLNDADTQNYLANFVDGKISASNFDEQLYFKLYESAHRRFPHNQAFVGRLLSYYHLKKMDTEWRELAAEYYFESAETRQLFLDDLAGKRDLRDFLRRADGIDSTIYTLFRADAAIKLSNFENAVAAYQRLNELYPHTPEFTEKLIALTRSFGQKNSEILNNSAQIAATEAAYLPANSEYRTRSGEIFAESGDYQKSNTEWAKLIPAASGEKQIYLDAATVYWDYFQYDAALETINRTRGKFADETLFAFETGVIYEAKHEQNQAIGEYIKALGATDEDEIQKEKAEKRLLQLARKTPEIVPAFDAAFAAEKRGAKNPAYLSLGYAEFLTKIKRENDVAKILNQAIITSADTDFLEAARNFYQTKSITGGEQFALARLAATAPNPRRKISYNLQIAASFEEANKREAAKNILARLVQNFPTNYGVLTDTSNFYWRLGFENESVQVLQNALPKAVGKYRVGLARKLAARLVKLNRLDTAEKILTDLHTEDKQDEETFRQLARICVRSGNADLLRKSFAETIAEIKETGDDRREIDEQIANLRTEMIDAFTRLKDYQAAIEQHIEIINREPENEELTENAIHYVQRYGGAKILRDYYLKLSAEAFKNYRWNVVLARIYTADGDDENAVKNYQTAIGNQPEIPELYLAVADIETKRGNFDAALKNIDEVLTLTNDAPENIKKKIEILKKAGRTKEIAAEQAKLPQQKDEKITLDAFAEARLTAKNEREKSRVLYRAAFAKLLENPIQNDFNAADIVAYVEIVRDEDNPLDTISVNLWNLREKLAAVADQNNSTDAGEARRRLSILDGAMLESIGTATRNFATDTELTNLHQDWQEKIEKFSISDAHEIIALVEDLSRRVGFSDLEEKILIKKIETSDSYKEIYVRNLVNFYDERGAFQSAFDALEKYGGNLPQIAEAARLIGSREKELEILRKIYWQKFDTNTPRTDENVRRYLEILRAENPAELVSLTEKNSAFQLQLINFLLGAGNAALAHEAIDHAGFSAAWKASRHAETSLALREFSDAEDCYFCDALQFDSIGNLIAQTPDKKSFLINDDWFKLTREYGEWLDEKQAGEDTHIAADFLPAMTENLPDSGDEQAKLGVYFLDKNEPEKAIKYFQLAIETDNYIAADSAKLAALGAAYFRANRRTEAEQSWQSVLDDGDTNEARQIEKSLILLQTLKKYDLSEKAREKIPPAIINFLKISDAENSQEFQNLIRQIADSFDDETEKVNYFLKILEKRPTDSSLAKMILRENLVIGREQNNFYELLLKRGDNLRIYDLDYEFQAVANRIYNADDAEAIYEQENNYQTDAPNGDALQMRREYLEILLDQNENARAANLVAETEAILDGKFARPDWLRAAKINLEIRAGNFDLATVEKYIGIIAPDAAASVAAPNVERFNDILNLLENANKTVDAAHLSEAFFARNLALENYGAANFTGLAKAFFRQNETEKALRLLRLAVKLSDETTQATAQAEIAAFDEIKICATDTAKTARDENDVTFDQTNALDIAASTAFEFDQKDAAIEFRRELLNVAPGDTNNKIQLAKILIADSANDEAISLLNAVITNRDVRRSVRWEARRILRAAGANIEFPDLAFDIYSQFYNGLLAEKSGNFDNAFHFFINAQITAGDAPTDTKQHLIKIYALTGRPFAALRLAASDKTAKSDELLQILSGAAENVNDFSSAIDYEKARADGGNAERIRLLETRAADRNRRATDFTIDAANTRNL